MKILIASYWALPFAGGIWTYVCWLKQGLEQMGHEVDIFACHPDEQHFYMLTDGRFLNKQDIRKLIFPKITRYYDQFLPQADDVLKRLESERYCFEAAAAYFGLQGYDLIHAQDVISTRALARVKEKKTPLVATIHGTLPNEFLLHGSVESKDSLLWRYLITQDYCGTTSSDLTIVPSQWMKQLLHEESHVPIERMTVIPYGMDIGAFLRRMEEPTDIEVPPDKKVIICPARLDVVKGHKILLQALAQLLQRRNNWVCWIVGDGYLQRQLQAKSERLGLTEHVQFLGTRHDVPALLRRSDLLVLPSLQDNLPFAVMEAQIAGTPVVSTTAGGIPEMVADEQTGLLSIAGDSAHLYANLDRMLTDTETRLRLAENAQRWGRERWSLDRMLQQTLDGYHTVLPSRDLLRYPEERGSN